MSAITVSENIPDVAIMYEFIKYSDIEYHVIKVINVIIIVGKKYLYDSRLYCRYSYSSCLLWKINENYFILLLF